MKVAAHSGWTRLAADELPEWDRRLLATDAELYQYPYWNEALRTLHFQPIYLIYRDRDEAAFVAVLTFGVPGFRIGIVRRGPVNLRGDGPLPHHMLKALADWLRDEGLVFVRFSHSKADLLASIASLGEHERGDAFPFLHEVTHDLSVPLGPGNEATLQHFGATARRKIRKAEQADYVIDSTDDPKALEECWAVFERLSLRKRYWLRPRASFEDLMRLARPHNCVRLYRAFREGRIVQAILVARERNRARYLVGALDVDTLHGVPSPSCLLHWAAMRDVQDLGCTEYSLGTESDLAFQFKRQFHPRRIEYRAPVTLILAPLRYVIWSKVKDVLIPRWSGIKRACFEPKSDTLQTIRHN